MMASKHQNQTLKQYKNKSKTSISNQEYFLTFMEKRESMLKTMIEKNKF